MKYPIGIQTFDQIIERGFVYVDKTDLVYSLATEGKIYFLSRPRRFGKSLLLSTLRAYFEGKKELFAGLKIDTLEKDWHVHRVFHFDFNGINFTVPGALSRILDSMLSEWEQEYSIVTDIRPEYGLRFSRILQAAAEQTGRGAVVLVDEYDKPLLDVLEKDPALLEENREMLKAFYSVFKQADASLRFVFLTGVTKFSQVSVFSGFNQPKDISMYGEYEALCGITEEELHTQFAEPIQEMAASEGCTEEEIRQRLKRHYDGYHFSKEMTDIYNPFSLLNAFDCKQEMAASEGCTEEEIRQRLKRHYDGYHFSKEMTDIYNPFSLLNAFDCKDIRDYWFASGTPSYLIRLMNHFHEGIDELTSKYYLPDEFINYKADIEYPLPMIYQSGYLTIKDYDKDSNLFLLDFPNNEVKSGFLAMVATNYLQCKAPLE